MTPTTETRLPIWQLRRTDLYWLLAYPLYQILGTIRHEGSHALVAKIEGATIDKFVFIPSTDLGRFTWGYTQWTGKTDWVVTFAPYFCDLLWFAGFFLICTRLRLVYHALWLNLVIIGLVSPLANSLVQYIVGFFSPQSDVAKLYDALPDGLVHLYFLVTLAAYGVGLWTVFRRSPRALLPDPPVE